MLVGLALRLSLGCCDKCLSVRSVPRWNLVTPPELARNAPGLDIFHPVEIGLLPVLRNELGFSLAHSGDGGFRQFLAINLPLVGQEGLDHDVRAVAMRNDVRL